MLVSIWCEVSSIMPTTQDLWSVHSSMPKTSLHIGEDSTVEDCKHTHIHSHTHIHTHTHTPTHTEEVNYHRSWA